MTHDELKKQWEAKGEIRTVPIAIYEPVPAVEQPEDTVVLRMTKTTAEVLARVLDFISGPLGNGTPRSLLEAIRRVLIQAVPSGFSRMRNRLQISPVAELSHIRTLGLCLAWTEEESQTITEHPIHVDLSSKTGSFFTLTPSPILTFGTVVLYNQGFYTFLARTSDGREAHIFNGTVSLIVALDQLTIPREGGFYL